MSETVRKICYYSFMKTSNTDSGQDLLSPLNPIYKVWNYIPKYTKIQFFSAFIIGLLVHSYIMANGFINHDSVVISEYYSWAHALSGRWFAIVPDMISSSFSLMWLNGLFAIIYISISICLIGACLEIRRTPLILLLSGLVVSFPAAAGWFSYRLYTDINFFAVLLVCVAIYLALRYKYGFLFGAIPLLFSIAIYQAYIGFFAGIFVLILIRDIFKDQKVKTIVVRGLKYLSTLIIGLVAYVIILNLPTYSGLTSYKEIDSFGGFTLQSLPERFSFSYQNFFDVFFRNTLNIHQDYMQSGQVFKYLFVITAIVIFVLLICIIINKKIYREIPRLILLFILIALLPPTTNAIGILSPNSIYILMQYSLVLIFVFMLMIVDVYIDSPKAGLSFAGSKIAYYSSWFVMVFCFIIIVNYTIYTNVFYYKMEIVNKQGYAFTSTLVTRIQSEDFYDIDKNIILYGELPQSYSLGYFENMHAIPLGDIPNMYSFPAYLLIYFDLRNSVSFSKAYLPPEINDNEDAMAYIRGMPPYPSSGSIAEVEGVIIVKYSD